MPVARLRPISRHIAAIDLHGRFQVAAFLVRHDGGLLLVDAGFPGWHYAILTAAESLPQPNRITHIVLTHAHVDHIGGAAFLARHSGAQVLASAVEKPFIEGRSLAHAACGILPRLVLSLNHWTQARRVEPVRVDRTVDAEDVVCGLRVVGVSGHTPGQIALWHEADAVLLCADALFNVNGSIGFDPVPGMTSNRSGAAASLARLAELGCRDVAPSHGPAILGDAPDRIRRFLGLAVGGPAGTIGER
ncbi:MAG: MBL fold metallo-hydrolase [Deltaproteobacteria bacterium]|nr:MBL fold metallo-hydrolase [Deltaproteobacteria bacterium]